MKISNNSSSKELYKSLVIRSVALLALLYIPYFLRHLIFNLYGIDYLVQIPSSLRLFSKILIFQAAAIMLLFFVIYNRNILSQIKIPDVKWPKAIFLGFISYLAFCAYYAVSIYATTNQAYYGIDRIIIITLHTLCLTIFAGAMVLAVFGHTYLKEIYTKTFPQAWYFAIGTAAVAFIVGWFQGLWHYFSYGITVILAWSFGNFYETYYWLDGKLPILEVAGFRVSIAEACSGIESMILFAIFAIGIYALDHKRLLTKRYIISSLIGFAGSYIVNIIRLHLLMLVGIYVSPEFAVGLFHTNIGWLMFVAYFFVYYLIARKYIYKKQDIADAISFEGPASKPLNRKKSSANKKLTR
jgi:exosortase/archaeosortase family protein